MKRPGRQPKNRPRPKRRRKSSNTTHRALKQREDKVIRTPQRPVQSNLMRHQPPIRMEGLITLRLRNQVRSSPTTFRPARLPDGLVIRISKNLVQSCSRRRCRRKTAPSLLSPYWTDGGNRHVYRGRPEKAIPPLAGLTSGPVNNSRNGVCAPRPRGVPRVAWLARAPASPATGWRKTERRSCRASDPFPCGHWNLGFPTIRCRRNTPSPVDLCATHRILVVAGEPLFSPI